MASEIPTPKPKEGKNKGMWLTPDGKPPAHLALFYDQEDPRNEELKVTMHVLTRMGIRNAPNVALAVVEALHEYRKTKR